MALCIASRYKNAKLCFHVHKYSHLVVPPIHYTTTYKSHLDLSWWQATFSSTHIRNTLYDPLRQKSVDTIEGTFKTAYVCFSYANHVTLIHNINTFVQVYKLNNLVEILRNMVHVHIYQLIMQTADQICFTLLHMKESSWNPISGQSFWTLKMETNRYACT